MTPFAAAPRHTGDTPRDHARRVLALHVKLGLREYASARRREQPRRGSAEATAMAILLDLGRADRPLRVHEMADRTGLSDRHAGWLARDLARRGILRRGPDMAYALAPAAGEDAA